MLLKGPVYMKKVPLRGLMMAAVILAGASGTGAERLGATEGPLAPCPNSPNCVSTQSDRKRHAMQPLPFLHTREASRERILAIIKGMRRTKIVTVTDSYIHAEYRTAFLRFVDDVEFFLDETARVVHFRSASRVGYYDFGVNRRRMKEISEKYVEGLERQNDQ
jgi:uncharacterized protein (DUF1499 family)